MSSSVSHCHLWSNEQLIDREVHHRRKIASYITGLTFSTVAAIEIPIVVPIAGFEAYKIHSHHKKLKVIREELTKRNLSPNEKKKRDILIPVTATAALHLVAIGIADAVNVVPDAMQAIIHEPIQQSFSLSEELMFKAANEFQAFPIVKVAEAGLEGGTKDTKYHNIKHDNH